MNILFYCDEYPPVRSGGIGTVTKIVAEELARRGHNIFVFSGIPAHYTLPEYSENGGVKIYRLKYYEHLPLIADLHRRQADGDMPLLLRLLNIFGISSYLATKEFKRTHKYLHEFVKEHNIDLIEFPDYYYLYSSLTVWKTVDFPKYDIPTVARVHGCISFIKHFGGEKIKRTIRQSDRSFYNSADSILAVSRFSADFLKDTLHIDKPVDVIYNPVEAEVLIETAKETDVPAKRDTIVFVGKITETKGAFNLLKAFEKYARKYPDRKLVMIGGGEIEKARRLVSESLRNRVIFTAYISREEICRYVRQSLFCVVPSFFENFSMVALEIMTMGRALIFTETASGPEIIEDGKDGLLVNPHDIDEICNKMITLTEDDRLRTDIEQAAAKKIIENFSVDAIVSKLEEYYKAMIDSRKS